MSPRNKELQLLGLPMRCRRMLDEGTSLSQDEIAPFWDFLQVIDIDRPVPPTEGSERLTNFEDVLCGGIAVMLADTGTMTGLRVT